MIYLDHHASAPIVPAARAAMAAALDAPHGNPSSLHRAGRSVRARIEAARASIAATCGALPRELVFTSGGTEALHLAARCAVGADPLNQAWVDPGAHPALRAAIEAVARIHGATVRTLPPDRRGLPDLEALRRALDSATGASLLGLTLVQHETGAIVDLPSLRAIARSGRVSLVLDAVQAFGKIPLDLGASGAVCAAISAHKIGGPTGIGAAWIRQDCRAVPFIEGGGQERGLRGGTENHIGIAGFGAAAEALPTRLAAMDSVARIRDRLEARLCAIEGVEPSIREGARVSTVSHAWIAGVDGSELVAALDLEGVWASSGPACSSGRGGVSASARAMFADRAERGAAPLRLSLGPETREDEVDRAADIFERVVARMRAAR